MKRLGLAVAGAVLAAGVVGGASFGTAASDARQQVQCGRLQAQIAVLQGEKRAAVAQGNEARANRLQTRISALQTRFSNECV